MGTRIFFDCPKVFTGLGDHYLLDQTIVVDDGLISQIMPTSLAPPREDGDRTISCADRVVMPGLIDVHTHLIFGNARSEEDVDFWATPEFRALRGLFFAQKVLSAGYTSVVVPGDGGNCSIAIRDAIRAGLFEGPRIAASSNVIANRHSLNDWFPEHVGTPDYVTGRLCTTPDAQIEEVRRQAKAGVNFIKIALDGTHFREDGTHIAAFTQAEVSAMVAEAHRLGVKVASHAYGKEAVLIAARAKVDLVFHAFYGDDECWQAMLESGSRLAPTLTFLRNNVDFSHAHEPSVQSGYAAMQARVIEVAKKNLNRARELGVIFLTGSDAGFAITPYGEWHAREIQNFVDWFGFTPAQALRAATSESAAMMPRGRPGTKQAARVGAIEVGRHADLIAVDGDPLQDVSVLLKPGAIRAVYLGGESCTINSRDYDRWAVTDLSSVKWTDVYTRAKVMAGLR